ncbi:SRPBCC domain-containing protein [Streptomyces sp. NPDC047453]|uniref:SRPBCC family protein n=1 Tax=Streptomyces sp. NPDC047453 TaxID=3154812 RepID=UPI0033EFECE3
MPRRPCSCVEAASSSAAPAPDTAHPDHPARSPAPSCKNPEAVVASRCLRLRPRTPPQASLRCRHRTCHVRTHQGRQPADQRAPNAVPAPVVWDFISSPEGLALWLDPGATLTPERGAPYQTAAGVTGEVRGFHPRRKIRVTRGATTLQIALTPTADGARAMLRFHQEHLAGAEERDQQRAHWQRIMSQVAAVLEQP